MCRPELVTPAAVRSTLVALTEVPFRPMQPRSGGADLSLHIPKLPLYVSPPRAVLQQAATPRALPISRSLSSARNVDDSRKSARANPMTRTLLVWGSNDAKRESPQVRTRAVEMFCGCDKSSLADGAHAGRGLALRAWPATTSQQPTARSYLFRTHLAAQQAAFSDGAFAFPSVPVRRKPQICRARRLSDAARQPAAPQKLSSALTAVSRHAC